MKEIKFRFWDKANNVMIDMHAMEYFARTETRNQKRFELMQFTGLKDKNGKEIFEGDIVKYRSREGYENRNCRKVVEWKDGGFNIKGEIVGTREVIGNIYENPELTTPTK